MVIIKRIPKPQPEPPAPSAPTLREQLDETVGAGPLRRGVGQLYAQRVRALVNRGMTSDGDIARETGLSVERVRRIRALLRSTPRPPNVDSPDDPWWRL